MSEREKCPIEPDKAIRFRYGDDEDDYLLIAPSHDSIVVFPDSRYNHVRYYDAEEGSMRMVWLPPEVLADLFDSGIPHTKRDSISECEYDGYLASIGQLAMDGVEIVEVEQLALPAGDPIEAEMQKAHEHFDAELNYYLREWE